MNKLRQAHNVIKLSSSDARDSTIKGIIESTLYEVADRVKTSELNQTIKKTFGVELYQNELLSNTEELKNSNKVIIHSGYIRLSDNREQEITSFLLEEKKKEDSRKAAIRTTMIQIAGEELTHKQTDKLYELYSKYLFEAFYLFGDNAYKYFHPSEKYDQNDISEEKKLKKIIYEETDGDHKLKDVFIEFIEHFESYINKDEADYLFEVSLKSNSFLSIGLSEELQQEVLYEKIIDWVILIDTNFIYSILNLHDHPEDFACKELVKTIRDNDLPIKLRFLPDTWKELMSKKKDWEDTIPKRDFTENQLKGILKSENIDGVAKRYIQEKLIKKREATHPVEIVGYAKKALKGYNIEVYNEKFNQLNEEYIDTRIQDYSSYIFNINEARLDKKIEPIHRSDKQLRHDIFLKEAIFDLRTRNNREFNSLNQAKYFGLSLDKILVKFDRYLLRKDEFKYKYFSFIKPSYLLNRLVRLLPNKTTDYKLAYLSALASKNFNYKGSTNNLESFKALDYLSSLGLDETETIFELISDDVFINKVSTLEGEELEEFVESSLSKKLSKSQKEIDKLEILNNNLKDQTVELSKDIELGEEKLGEVETQKDVYKSSLSHEIETQKKLTKEIGKLRRELKKSKNKEQDTTVNIQQQMTFNNTSNVNEKEENEKSESKPWYKRVWVIIISILTALSLIAKISGVTLSDFYDFFGNEEKNVTNSDPNYEEKKDSIIKEKSKVIETNDSSNSEVLSENLEEKELSNYDKKTTMTLMIPEFFFGRNPKVEIVDMKSKEYSITYRTQSIEVEVIQTDKAYTLLMFADNDTCSYHGVLGNEKLIAKKTFRCN